MVDLTLNEAQQLLRQAGPRLRVDGSAGELTKRSLQVTGGDRLADLDFPGVPTSNEAMLTNAIQGQSVLTLSGLEGPSEPRRQRVRRGVGASAAPKRG